MIRKKPETMMMADHEVNVHTDALTSVCYEKKDGKNGY
jgi:hypothetical protein